MELAAAVGRVVVNPLGDRLLHRDSQGPYTRFEMVVDVPAVTGVDRAAAVGAVAAKLQLMLRTAGASIAVQTLDDGRAVIVVVPDAHRPTVRMTKRGLTTRRNRWSVLIMWAALMIGVLTTVSTPAVKDLLARLSAAETCLAKSP